MISEKSALSSRRFPEFNSSRRKDKSYRTRAVNFIIGIVFCVRCDDVHKKPVIFVRGLRNPNVFVPGKIARFIEFYFVTFPAPSAELIAKVEKVFAVFVAGEHRQSIFENELVFVRFRSFGKV